jgi:hypothetical protein
LGCLSENTLADLTCFEVVGEVRDAQTERFTDSQAGSRKKGKKDSIMSFGSKIEWFSG